MNGGVKTSAIGILGQDNGLGLSIWWCCLNLNRMMFLVFGDYWCIMEIL